MVGPYSAGTEFQVTPYMPKNTLFNPSVTRLASGFIVTWRQINRGVDEDKIAGRRYDWDAHPLRPVSSISDHRAYEQRLPRTAPSPKGFYAVWDSFGQDGSRTGIFGRLFDPTAMPISPEVRLNDYTSGDQQKPDVARVGNGFVAIWWGTSANDPEGVYGQLIDDKGQTVGGNFAANSRMSGRQTDAHVAANDFGFLVVWQSLDQDGSGWGVYGQLYNGTAYRIGSELHISTETGGHQSGPRVAASSNEFACIWINHSSPSENQARVQRLNHTAQLVGPEVEVTNGTSVGSPTIAPIPSGFVAATIAADLREINVRMLDERGLPQSESVHIKPQVTGQPSELDLGETSFGFVAVWRHERENDSSNAIVGRAFRLAVPASSGSPFNNSVRSTTFLPGTSPMLSTSAAMGRFSIAYAPAPLDESNAVLVALTAIIVGLILSLCGGAGLFFRQRRKLREKDAPAVLRTPVYEEVSTEPDQIYAVLPASTEQRQSNYSDWPRQEEPIYEELELREDSHYVQNINDIMPGHESASESTS